MVRRHHRRGVRVDGPLAVAVIGGMVSSTLLTLVVVPAVYSLVEGGLARLDRWRGATAGASSGPPPQAD